MTRAVFSSVIGVESAATMRVDVPMIVQTQAIYMLSTTSGSTTSMMESFSCFSTNSLASSGNHKYIILAVYYFTK